MRASVCAIGLTIAAVATIDGGGGSAAATRGQSSGVGAQRRPATAAEFDKMFVDYSNWGRWGKADELGAMNLITSAKRRQATSLVKSGISVSIAHNPLMEKADDNPSPFQQLMAKSMTTDTYTVDYHGYSHSHIDALCHFLHKDRTYNGFSRSDVLSENGCKKLGIQNLKNGIVTRGILLDIPRLKGVPYLEPGAPVYVEDIEAWEKKARVRVSAGDAILLRTGRWARRERLGPWKIAGNVPGYHASVLPWIKKRDVAVVGSDVVQDVMPTGVEGVGTPVHTFLIAGLGINLLDNQDLEALSETAAKLNRWDFMLTIQPIPVTGGTGSPVNAIATF